MTRRLPAIAPLRHCRGHERARLSLPPLICKLCGFVAEYRWHRCPGCAAEVPEQHRLKGEVVLRSPLSPAVPSGVLIAVELDARRGQLVPLQAQLEPLPVALSVTLHVHARHHPESGTTSLGLCARPIPLAGPGRG